MIQVFMLVAVVEFGFVVLLFLDAALSAAAAWIHKEESSEEQVQVHPATGQLELTRNHSR